AFLAAGMVVLSSPARGKIMGGVCGDCHTMHHSQTGEPVATDLSGNPLATPFSRLLVSSCLGCHSGSSAETVYGLPVTNTPVVNNLADPAHPLAGGNFYYVGLDDSNGHNVLPSNPDDLLGTDPPGGAFPSGGSYTEQLRCAGTRGCHGLNGGHGEAPVDDQLMAMDGAHHDRGAPLDGSSVGRSYRYLNGISGKEAPDWEYDQSVFSHNEYAGANGYAITNTISYFCAECHGTYHSSADVGLASPWFRHPTDTVLPAGPTEYSIYNSYSLLAPVARPDPFNVLDTTKVTPGEDTVMCLSCHRSHGSPYYKAMRWDYRSPDLATVLCPGSPCGDIHDGSSRPFSRRV
ncbi:MAG: hypothetical protein P8Y75_09375, partial [Nitrospirota bacterium]